MAKSIKCIVVGDKGVGKTTLLSTYITNSFPGQNILDKSDRFTINTKIEEQDIRFLLWNIAMEVDYDRLRALTYPFTDIFLVCFSLVSPISFRNVERNWVPELQHHCPNTPILLVGTKLDLREDQETNISTLETNQNSISFDEGRKLAEKIRAVNYHECSAISQEGIKDVFDEAMSIALNKVVKEGKKEKKK